MKKKNLILIINICLIILSMVIASIPVTYQSPAATKLYIIPPSILGNSTGETFTVDLYLENVTELSSWTIGLLWNPAVLQCNSWTTNWGGLLGPLADWIGFDGYLNNTLGQTEPPWVYSLKAGRPTKNGSDTIATVEFQVLDYGFSWINFSYSEIKVTPAKVPIAVDVTNSCFALYAVPPAAPVASFTYSPPAPEANKTVTFDATTSVLGWNGTGNVPIANYTWDFGDGTVTTTTNPVINHNYTTAGTFTVNLTVTCGYDPVLICQGLTSNSAWQDVIVKGAVHDVAVIGVTPSPTEAVIGETVFVNVTVKNVGNFTETFDVTAYYDNTAIDTKTVTNLASGANETITINWVTIDVDEGDYTIKAVAGNVTGETETSDNTFIDGTVTVTAPKLRIIPASIVGPPPGIGETFTINITIENIINLTSWQIGLAVNGSILNCTSWTTLFNTAVMGPPGPLGWIGIDGTPNSTVGGIYPPGAYSLSQQGIDNKAWKSGNGTLVQINFTVVGYGFTWINLTCFDLPIKVRIGPDRTSIPIDVLNGSFTLLPPVAPVANFTYSPSAPEVDEQVTFNASASLPGFNSTHNVPIANYTWDFGDGTVTTTTSPTVSHTYTANGTYTVNLTVTCEYDPILIAEGLTSDSMVQNITITEVPVVLVHDVAVTSVSPSPTEVTEGENVTITVIVENKGDFTETFTVTVYYNTTAIGTQTVTNLAPGATKTLTFTWDTTDVDKGDYTIKAVASPVEGEEVADQANNTRIADDMVTVKAPTPAIPWLWIILAIIIIIAVIIIAYWMLRRK